MAPYLLHTVLVLWAVAFAATMGWAAALAGPIENDWTDESTWGMR